MAILVLGLLVFLGVHLIPTAPAIKAALVGRLGAGGFKALFTIASFIGLALIIWGYRAAGVVDLWVPPVWARHLALVLMLPATILLVAAYVPSRIRTKAKHPMLAAVKIWAVSHLLANGDLASVLLFGSFLAYAVYDRISVKRRAALGPLGAAPGTATGDLIVLAAGIGLYALIVLWAHAAVIGVAVLPGRG